MMTTGSLPTLVLVILLITPVLTSPIIATHEGHVLSLTLTNVTEGLLSSCRDFPDYLHVSINASLPFPPSFVLHRKDVINTDPPVYVIDSGKDEGVFLSRIESEGTGIAAYQNTELGAAFIAKCTEEGFSLAGSLHVDDVKYRVFRQSVMTSLTVDYEFVVVKETLHYDDKLQGKQEHKMGSLTKLDLDIRSSDSHQNSRAKRETKDYYLDVLVILDYSAYLHQLKLAGGNSTIAIQKAKEYMVYIFNEINIRYNTVTSSTFRLHVVLCGFIIAQTAKDSPWTETVKEPTATGTFRVRAVNVLNNLENFLKTNYSDLPEHDHVMLITEYDLYSDDNGFRFNNTAGYAEVGTMCRQDGSSVSVVEDHGGFQSETTVTHELGHSLGALHDGNNNTCKTTDRFVMAGSPADTTSANKLNPWRFSPCSSTYFEDFVKSLIQAGYEDTCLLKRAPVVGVPTVQGYPGERVGPDDQCRQIYGASSYLCRGTNFGNAEDICLSMYCRNPATVSSCTLLTAVDGTCCGDKKWCVEGQCLSSNNASCYMSATCPFGQRQGIVFKNLTCDQLASGNCYDENFRHVCCEMCDRMHTTLYGCEYGDKVLNCESKYCGVTLNGTGQLYDAQCCGTCSHNVTTLTPVPTVPSTTAIPVVPDLVNTCRDTVLINGLEECSVFINRSTGQCCKQNVRTDLCCKACEAVRNRDDPQCPYGDCQNCQSIQSRPVPCPADLRASCCQTCKALDLKFSTTAPSTSTGPVTTRPSSTSVPDGPSTTAKCKPLPGIHTCGAEGLRGNRVVMMSVMMMMVVVVLLVVF